MIIPFLNALVNFFITTDIKSCALIYLFHLLCKCSNNFNNDQRSGFLPGLCKKSKLNILQEHHNTVKNYFFGTFIKRACLCNFIENYINISDCINCELKVIYEKCIIKSLIVIHMQNINFLLSFFAVLI